MNHNNDRAEAEKWLYGPQAAARLVARTSWPWEREENRDKWAEKLLTDADMLEHEADNARRRLESAIAACARAAVVDPTAKDHDIAGYGCRKCGLRTAEIAPDSDCVRVVDPHPTKTEIADRARLLWFERFGDMGGFAAAPTTSWAHEQARAELSAGGGES